MGDTHDISDAFEEAFFAVSLETQIKHCDHYELADLFLRVLPDHQPILEAGSGSGRWVGWFVNQGWRATGVDWSESLCAAAREVIPGGAFLAADIASIPLAANTFGSVVALGSIEHTEEGPAAILSELRRVLAADGVAIVTVPYLGPVRRVRRALRRMLGKQEERSVSAPTPYAGTWEADYQFVNGDWSFFQYVFSKQQMRQFVGESGFAVVREFADFKDEGVLHNFGRVVGTYDYEAGRVRLNFVGRLLRSLLPASLVGHMLCYQLSKPA